MNKQNSFFKNSALLQQKHQKFIVILFFGLYFLIGCFIYDDYGISWDETISRYNGLITVKYLISNIYPELADKIPALQQIPDLHKWKDKDYGVVFEVPLILLENLFGIKNNHSPFLYHLRHFCTFLFFFIGIFHLFLLLKYRFNSWRIGLLGCLLIITSPRIFADSFYNDKDIILLSSFIMTSYYLLQYFSIKSLRNAFWLGLFMAVTVNVRIIGIFIPAITLGFIFVDFCNHKRSINNTKRLLASMSFLFLVFVAFTIILWPYLWENPLQNFLQAFHNMSKFRWNYYVLYAGNFIRATNVPWHYIPVWIAITTPVIYLMFFIIGLIPILVASWQAKINLYNTDAQRQDLIMAALFFGPLLAVILMKSVLYDGWRQMFFLYGPFIYITIRGIVFLKGYIFSNRNLKTTGLYNYFINAVLIFNIVNVVIFMFKNHPHQNVYFNFLAGNNVGDKFERDYWGLSYRQGLEYIVEVDKRDTITIAANMLGSGRTNGNMLPEEVQKRVQFTLDINKSDYFLTEHRFTGGFKWYPNDTKFEEVHSIVIDGFKIMSVYKSKSL